MVPCRIHPTIYSIPGKECHTCTVEAEAEARNNKETDERNGRTQKAKQDAFFVGDKARKKPGVKVGRLSFDNGTYRVS